MKWLTILFTLFLLLIIVLADTGNLGVFGSLYRIPYADKAGHFILYGILALLTNLTLFRSLPNQNRIRVAVIGSLVLIVLIGIEEFSQRSFSNRTFSLEDLGASYLGVIFFSWLAVRRARNQISPTLS
jgi:polysaccharide biosynthesis protein VpsQ